jgi:hypothetical protein
VFESCESYKKWVCCALKSLKKCGKTWKNLEKGDATTDFTEGAENWPAWVFFDKPFLDVNICGRRAYSPLACRGGKAFGEADQMSHT